jgi:hypothetical protein
LRAAGGDAPGRASAFRSMTSFEVYPHDGRRNSEGKGGFSDNPHVLRSGSDGFGA